MGKKKEDDCSKNSKKQSNEFDKDVECPECGHPSVKTCSDNPDYYICPDGHRFKKTLRQIWDDKDEFRQNKMSKARFKGELKKNEMSNLLSGTGVTGCDECSGYLGLSRLLFHSMFKKKGTTYYVVCKHCHHVNRRVKGEYKKEIDELFDGNL